MKKLVFVAAALVATVSLSGIAEAGWRHHHDWEYNNHGWEGYRHHHHRWHDYRRNWESYSQVYVQPDCESDYGDY